VGKTPSGFQPHAVRENRPESQGHFRRPYQKQKEPATVNMFKVEVAKSASQNEKTVPKDATSSGSGSKFPIH
jgi:hypothetical protein